MAITIKELIDHARENNDIDARIVNSHTRWLDYVKATLRDIDQKDDEWDNYVDDVRAEYDDRIADLETELAGAREEEDD